MNDIVEIYRGATIYEIGHLDKSQGQQIRVKLTAKAVLSEPPNLQVDFEVEAQNQEKGYKKIHKTVDEYLARHDMREFARDT